MRSDSVLKGRRNPFVAREGIPWLTVILIAGVLTWHFLPLHYSVVPLLAFAWLAAVFRDPRREIPASPLGVISPVDGVVVDAVLTDRSVLGGEAFKVVIAVNSLGTYTARSPVEGRIMDFHVDGKGEYIRRFSTGLWIRTDEGDDVVLQFHGHRLGLVPHAFLRFGERVGQGQRCAYLRLTRVAEVQFPINGRLLVEKGRHVKAGTDILGKLPPP